jgi:hypothetical protein
MDNPELNASNNGQEYSVEKGAKRNNIVTTRGDIIYHEQPSVKQSRNMAEARINSLRLYKRICRLMPFILHVWKLYAHGKVNLHNSKMNIAEHFREKKHIRDPRAIDMYLNYGYMTMHNAEHKYSDWYHFERFLLPGKSRPGDEGVSYLDKVKYSGKSSFLTKFYKGDRPNY